MKSRNATGCNNKMRRDDATHRSGDDKHNATGSDDKTHGNVMMRQGRGNKTQRQNTTTNQTKQARTRGGDVTRGRDATKGG